MINCLLLLEQSSKRDDTIFSYKNQVYNLQQKLNDLHPAQSSSYNSIDNNDFMNKGNENDDRSNKNRSGSEFQYNRSFNESFKVAATDMRYFARTKLSRSLVHKKNFSLIWQVDFNLGYLFCQ